MSFMTSAVRVRPLSRSESEHSASLIVRMRGGVVEVLPSNAGPEGTYAVDHAMWSANVAVRGNKSPPQGQADVYKKIGSPLSDILVSGLDATLLVCGADGTGRRHSIFGDADDGGLLPRIFSDVRSREKSRFIAAEVSVVAFQDMVGRCLIGTPDAVINVVTLPNNVLIASGTTVATVQSDADLLEVQRVVRRNLPLSPFDALYVQCVFIGEGSDPFYSILRIHVFDDGNHDFDRALTGAASRIHSASALSPSIALALSAIEGKCPVSMLCTISPASSAYASTIRTLQIADRARKVIVQPSTAARLGWRSALGGVREVNVDPAQAALWTAALRRFEQPLQERVEETAFLIQDMNASVSSPLINDPVAILAQKVASLEATHGDLQEIERLRSEIALLEAKRHTPAKATFSPLVESGHDADAFAQAMVSMAHDASEGDSLQLTPQEDLLVMDDGGAAEDFTLTTEDMEPPPEDIPLPPEDEPVLDDDLPEPPPDVEFDVPPEEDVLLEDETDDIQLTDDVIIDVGDGDGDDVVESQRADGGLDVGDRKDVGGDVKVPTVQEPSRQPPSDVIDGGDASMPSEKNASKSPPVVLIHTDTITNARYLKEMFRVFKIDEGALIGARKERIWELDVVGRKISNIDMDAVVSFVLEGSNFFKCERHPTNGKRLTLYFFEATHPYELEFSSVERRCRFCELVTMLRRSTVIWTPSFIPDGHDDCILDIKGTTVMKSNGRIARIQGDSRVILSRMPYEVIDMWCGVLDLGGKDVPPASALSGFLPPTTHELYIISLLRVPHVIKSREALSTQFLKYLGAAVYFSIATHITKGTTSPSASALLIICRRSFLSRVSHLAVSTLGGGAAAKKVGGFRNDYESIGASFRFNETHIGVAAIGTPSVSMAPEARSTMIRSLIGDFPGGDTSVDIGARFHYFIVMGSLGYDGGFTDQDSLLRQMKLTNVFSDASEGTPSMALKSQANALRVLYMVRPRVSRMDVKSYQSSAAVGVRNVYIAADVFCLRPFLGSFAPEPRPVSIVLDRLTVVGHRLPTFTTGELVVTSEFIEGSEGLVVPIAKSSDAYIVSSPWPAVVYPVSSHTEFLRLQQLTFTVKGILPALKEKDMISVASATLPLKDMLELSVAKDFSTPLYYRGCTVGILQGSVIKVYGSKDLIDLKMAKITSEAPFTHVVSCFENQVLEVRRSWVGSIIDQGAHEWSLKDVNVGYDREKEVLPSGNWKWLSPWTHESRANDPDGWYYSSNFGGYLDVNFDSNAHRCRRRRWIRVLQAPDALSLHSYIDSKHQTEVCGQSLA